MIAIVNRTEETDGSTTFYGKGEQHYTLQINNKILTRFTHTFEDGLSRCLYKAYKAAKAWEQATKVPKEN